MERKAPRRKSPAAFIKATVKAQPGKLDVCALALVLGMQWGSTPVGKLRCKVRAAIDKGLIIETDGRLYPVPRKRAVHAS